MTKTIGVIGLGSIGMRHAKSLLAMGCEVHGFDPDREKLFELVSHGGHEMESRQYRGIVIATPTNQHASDLCMLGWITEPLKISATTPLFIEKPVADKTVELPPNLKMVGYNLRFHSCVKKAKEWLGAGLIGEPIWANFTVAQHNEKYTDSVILNWSHEIDLALYLLGPAKVMACVASSDETLADIILRHEGNLGLRQTTVHLDYATNPEERSFIIGGSKGNMQFSLTNPRGGMLELPSGSTKRFRAEDSFDENYISEMQAFLDRIDGKQTIGCTGEEGLAVLEICLEARKMAGLA